MAFISPLAWRACSLKNSVGFRVHHERNFIPSNAARFQCQQSKFSGRWKQGHKITTMLSEDNATDEVQELEKKRQEERRYVFREFGKISVAAMCIGLVLLFYDILISLIAISVGSIYAIAVLLQVRGADKLLGKMGHVAASVLGAVANSIRNGYRAVRREVRKGLED